MRSEGILSFRGRPWKLFAHFNKPNKPGIARTLSESCMATNPADEMVASEHGVFGVDKPPNLSSAQVIRNLQHVLNKSSMFSSSLREMQENSMNQRTYRRRKPRPPQVKMGHGGTLDPMATGVLVLGIGSGTKMLPTFLSCTKSYEATITFGFSTDTYDSLGMVVEEAPFRHISLEMIEKVLEKFRGSVMQRAPIYSARRIDGKRLYEYARQGQALPREIEERQVMLHDLEILEWSPADPLSPSTTSLSPSHAVTVSPAKSSCETTPRCRDSNPPLKSHTEPNGEVSSNSEIPNILIAEPSPMIQEKDTDSEAIKKIDDQNHEVSVAIAFAEVSKAVRLPTLRLRMTVSSGFYVRSLAHDLGLALKSFACMSALVRTRQAHFALGDNVIPYDLFREDEIVWASELQRHLAKTHTSKV